MANYVANKVLCSLSTFKKLFYDEYPFGENEKSEEYITFNHIIGVNSIPECERLIHETISYGFGDGYTMLDDGRIEVKFHTRWDYPFMVILKALELDDTIEWYAVEENEIYVSKFYVDDNKIVEDTYPLESDEEYDNLWREIADVHNIYPKNWDSTVWWYHPELKTGWCRTRNSANEIHEYYDSISHWKHG